MRSTSRRGLCDLASPVPAFCFSTSRLARAAFSASHRSCPPYLCRSSSLSLPPSLHLSAFLCLSLCALASLSSLLVPFSRAACAIAFTHLAQPPRVSQTSKRMTSTIGYAYIASLLALSPCLHHLLDHVLVIPRFSRTTCLLDSDARHRSSPFLPLSLRARSSRTTCHSCLLDSCMHAIAALPFSLSLFAHHVPARFTHAIASSLSLSLFVHVPARFIYACMCTIASLFSLALSPSRPLACMRPRPPWPLLERLECGLSSYALVLSLSDLTSSVSVSKLSGDLFPFAERNTL